MEKTVKEKLKKTTPILIFNILLPTIDVITDLLIIIRLFEGSYKCNQDETTTNLYEYEQCKAYGPNNYCSSLSNICKIKDIHPFFEDKCQKGNGLDVVKNMCKTTGHPMFATAMLLPFLVNYLVTFYLWTTINRNPKTVIFPLLNIFPQYGNSKYEIKTWNIKF